MNDKILRVGIMCRVSTDEQALHGDSLEAQETTLVEYANTHNMKIFKIYRDAGFSARKPVLKRPAMLELLQDVEAGKLDMILFTKLDRWFRNIQEYYKIQEILDRNKVVWKSILEDYSTATADGRFKVNIMLSVNEQEADRTSERIKFVFQSKVMRKEAIFANHNAPFGYKVAEIDGVKRVVKNDDAREATEYFFNIALTTSIRNAAIMTNQKYGLTRDYNSWLNMCHNEMFKGSYKGVEDYCEPYLTPAQFSELSKDKGIRKARSERVYLFSRLIRCPKCGAVMIAKNQAKENNKEYNYYRCPNTVTKKCSMKMVSEKLAETYLLENIHTELQKYILSHEVSQTAQQKKRPDATKYKEQLRRLNVSYHAGNMDDDEYLAKAKELKIMIEKALSEEAPDNTVDISTLKNFLNSGFEKIYDSLTRLEKQRLWRSVVDELIYDGTTIVGIKFKV